MAGGNAIRGTRVGAGPMGEAERGEAAPRNRIPFWCANLHETRVSFASEADVPELWDCPRCGLPAGQDQASPPPAPRNEKASFGMGSPPSPFTHMKPPPYTRRPSATHAGARLLRWVKHAGRSGCRRDDEKEAREMRNNDREPIQELRDLVRRRQTGSISRRSFMRGVTALGLSLPLATMLERHGVAALQATPEGEGRTPSGELTIVLPRSLVSLDPHGAQSVEEATAVISSHVLDTLLVRDAATGELVPRLATSWQALEPTAWEFKLRDGVTWHDGSPFTSADVKASLERVQTLEGPLAPLWALVNAIETPDDLTVIFRTSEPQGTVPVSASLFFITPAAQSNNEGFFDQPVGIGPYRFESWTRDAELRLEASPDYWGGAPGIQTLIFRDIQALLGATDDPVARVATLAGGALLPGVPARTSRT